MTRYFQATLFLIALATATALRADLTRAKAEPNLERRARLALDNAEAQVRLASAAGKTNDWPAAQAALKELRESVDLAYASLNQTGKTPRNSRQYKNIEVKLRGIIKNTEDYRGTLDFEQREALAPLMDHLRRLHDEVLQRIMAPKK